jgi:hypothetical protein
VIMSLRSVSGSLWELKSALGYLEQGSALDYQDTPVSLNPIQVSL